MVCNGMILLRMVLRMVTVVVEDVVVFFMLFEGMLLVMVSMVSTYWYSSRGVYALSMLVVYTILGSGVLGVAMIAQYLSTGCTSSMHTMQWMLLSTKMHATCYHG